MNERPNPKKLVPDPQPRRETSKVLVAAAVLLFALFALLAFWLLQ